MNNINAIKTGSVINLSINGKLEKKVCSSVEDANVIYKMILVTKENPTDDNVKKLYAFLNDTTRIATIAGLEIDVVNGNTYLEGFNTPLPQNIIDVIQEYYENDFPCESIINFWKLLMVNHDVRVRETLFGFLTKYNFVLTEHGYFVTYKAVKDLIEPKVKETPIEAPKKAIEDDLTRLVNDKYFQVKKWKKAAKNFTVYQKDDKYFVAETKTFKGDASTIGVLNELYDSLNPIAKVIVIPSTDIVVGKPFVEVPTKTFTDKRTGKMRIKLGQPVKMERKKCNGDPAVECSYGLHVGTTIYVKKFANPSDTVLTCLVNPAHVIAVPKYDNTKMRVCEYFPLAIIESFSKKEVNSGQAFFENDYIAYEKAELEEMVNSIKQNQLPIEATINSKPETRSMEELLKIIESRLVDIK